jgi:virulence-associated protein E
MAKAPKEDAEVIDLKTKQRAGAQIIAAAEPAEGAGTGEDASAEGELDRLIAEGCGDHYEGDASKAIWRVCRGSLCRGYTRARIVEILLDPRNGISKHFADMDDAPEYAAQQVEQAAEKLDLSVNDKGKPHLTQNNVRVALRKLGVELRYDAFADHMLIDGLAGFAPVLDDASLRRLRLQIDQRFKLKVSKDWFADIVLDMARLNSFHPVREYLDSRKWDGVKRIDQWLITYAGAKDTPYVRAVGKLWLLAAVRRVRKPGVKFDEALIFESDQGLNKSSALQELAVKPDWFTDDVPLTADGKKVIEATRGKWICELAELKGMKQSDIEHLKAWLSRKVDRARMSYDRLPSEVPRQWVPAGTTNSVEYLRDNTGNRRFWGVTIQAFDLVKLTADRDQLWAEAAAREAAEESIRLDESLWEAAAKEQEARLTKDPYFEALQAALVDDDGEMEGKIASESIWVILGARAAQRSQEANERVGTALRKLGWTRPSENNNKVRIKKRLVLGYVKGEKPWRPIIATRDEAGDVHVHYTDALDPKDDEDPE